MDTFNDKDWDKLLKEYWEDDDYEDDDDRSMFADPGGNSALRASSPSNPRNLPCPTCEQPDRLTPADHRLGYQCDECADRAEGGYFESDDMSVEAKWDRLTERMNRQRAGGSGPRVKCPRCNGTGVLSKEDVLKARGSRDINR
jgi:hypothetical protein